MLWQASPPSRRGRMRPASDRWKILIVAAPCAPPPRRTPRSSDGTVADQLLAIAESMWTTGCRCRARHPRGDRVATSAARPVLRAARRHRSPKLSRAAGRRSRAEERGVRARPEGAALAARLPTVGRRPHPAEGRRRSTAACHKYDLVVEGPRARRAQGAARAGRRGASRRPSCAAPPSGIDVRWRRRSPGGSSAVLVSSRRSSSRARRRTAREGRGQTASSFNDHGPRASSCGSPASGGRW